ncbi:MULTISPECIES: RNA-binding protein [Niveibacterium]|uniref:RNA-binding protein n=1 Tax=Niveibacterium microcysteis TaxID=2811415 RepID=A0ABX7MBX6_9RHOO|nr:MULTISPECIES: RNA-binding protein [Niveibacterium]QSI78899.1 RNA-binding protein [Niveibacterium microcysteis]
MSLWIANINPEATDDDIRELVRKYCGIEVPEIRREPGDGSRPAAQLIFPDVNNTVLQEFQKRLHGMFWKDRTISVQIM